MKSVWRSLVTLSVLAGLASPGILTLGITAHLALDDHHRAPAGHYHAAAFELAVHGHHHDTDVPDHAHPLILTMSAPLSAKKAPEPAAASSDAYGFDLAFRARGESGPQPVPDASPPPVPPVPLTLRI